MGEWGYRGTDGWSGSQVEQNFESWNTISNKKMITKWWMVKMVNGKSGETVNWWNGEWGCRGSYGQMEHQPLPRPFLGWWMGKWGCQGIDGQTRAQVEQNVESYNTILNEKLMTKWKMLKMVNVLSDGTINGWNDEWGCRGSYEQMEYPPLPRPL